MKRRRPTPSAMPAAPAGGALLKLGTKFPGSAPAAARPPGAGCIRDSRRRVVAAQMAQAHQQRRARRQRQQHAGSRTTGRRRAGRDDCHRVQADALADQDGVTTEPSSAWPMPNTIHTGTPAPAGTASVWPPARAEPMSKPTKGKTSRPVTRPIGRRLQPRENRAELIGRHQQHHRKLPAQEFGQHGVDLLCDAGQQAIPAPRTGFHGANSVDPVAQQVEQNYRYQQQGDDETIRARPPNFSQAATAPRGRLRL